VILVGGGEPFLNPHIMTLLKDFEVYMKEGRIQICTNGQHLNDRIIAKLVDCQAIIRLSVNSLNHSHLFTRGRRFRYLPLLEKLSDNLPIIVSTALTKVNFNEIIGMIKPLSRLPIIVWAIFQPLLAGNWVRNYKRFGTNSSENDKLILELQDYIGDFILSDGIEAPIENHCERMVTSRNLYIDVLGHARACYARPDLKTHRNILKSSIQELVDELSELRKNCNKTCPIYLYHLR
jgi:MoaA/NifB/PqqE/SkfB family radical SAM enzyme